jgi:hypothetical protein
MQRQLEPGGVRRKEHQLQAAGLRSRCRTATCGGGGGVSASPSECGSSFWVMAMEEHGCAQTGGTANLNKGKAKRQFGVHIAKPLRGIWRGPLAASGQQRR